MPRKIIRESTIEMYVRDHIRQRDGVCVKFPAMYISGFPDRIVMMPGGNLWFVEFKTGKKKPTILQEQMHERLRRLGFRVWVVSTRQEARLFLNEVDDEMEKQLI